ncbi:retrovirus-related pol polyprotein from transposon TNT 1-94 [Tanacetum coccineum]
MDVKTAFLNDILKALYGLKQAPRAWYDLLSSFLLSEKFTIGTVDPTLFVRREGKDISLVQIYVDDIIFASTKPDLCETFSKVMCSKFKMSMMGKLSFFLGLKISQSPKGIFLNQSKYALESLKKYGMETCDPADTPMVEKSKLDEDPQGKAVDPTCYHGMIGTLVYLTSNRPDLVFAVCMCARYQAKPIEKHLHADSCIALTSFADADHAGCQDTRIITSGMTTRDEKWVPSTERVKISSTNVRVETTVQPMEETFQVVINIIKNSTYFKAFTISADKCIIDAEVFRKILDICPRFEGVDFTEVPDDDATLTFLIELGYKGPLHKHTNMFVDHMHQPWRTLAAIINKCLSGKTASNDKLRKSRIDILWGMGSHLMRKSTVVAARPSSEGTGTKRGVPDEEKVTSEEKVFLSTKKEDSVYKREE